MKGDGNQSGYISIEMEGSWAAVTAKRLLT